MTVINTGEETRTESTWPPDRVKGRWERIDRGALCSGRCEDEVFMGHAHGEAGQKGLSCLDSFSVSVSTIWSPGVGDRNRDETSLSVETILDPRDYIYLNNLKGSW